MQPSGHMIRENCLLSQSFDARTNGGQTTPAPESSSDAAKAWPSGKRRSVRLKALIPVFVYGYDSAVQPFHEDAYAALVSEHGGLLIMNTQVQLGQPLLLTNRATQEERPCRVAYIGAREPDQSTVAVEFAEPAPGFWRLTNLGTGRNSGAKTDEKDDGETPEDDLAVTS